MNIAIIPARGGSKRIPRKNIRPFCGKPMLAWAIETAVASACVDQVIVSTDDAAIAQVAREYGAEVPFMRPAELADDHTGTVAVVRHALKWLQQHGRNVEYCCCLYATSPLLEAADLRQGLARLRQQPEIDFVFSAARFGFPIQRALLQQDDGGVIPFDPTSIGKRSQDLSPAFHDAGQFYWGLASAFLDPGKRIFSPNSRLYLLPAHRVQDIDDEEDWRRAEMLKRLLLQEARDAGSTTG